MKIIMATDVVSPFCWIGAVQLEQAIALRPNVVFELELWPFQVTPGLPDDYTFARYEAEHMTGAHGSVSQFRQTLKVVKQLGLSIDLDFQFDKLTVWPNTKKAHGLWLLGETPQQRWQLHKALCKAHFNEQRDLNDVDTLAEIGVSLGLKAQVIRHKLTDEDYICEVLEATEQTRRQGISSVPFFVFDNRYELPGAKGCEAILAVIDRVLAEQAA